MLYRYSVFCEKQGVKETPTVMIYPPNPVPAFKIEGKLEGKAAPFPCRNKGEHGRNDAYRSLLNPITLYYDLFPYRIVVCCCQAVFNKLAKFMPDQTERITKVRNT